MLCIDDDKSMDTFIGKHTFIACDIGTIGDYFLSRFSDCHFVWLLPESVDTLYRHLNLNVYSKFKDNITHIYLAQLKSN